MLKKSKYNAQVISFLVVVALTFFGCAQDQKEDTTNEAEAAMTEQSEQAQTINTDANSKSEVWNKICPVCGGPVSEDLKTVTFEGKVYGFGCVGCPEQFEANPQDFVKNLNEDGTEFVGG